jgi:hypothetical protein
MAAEIHVGDYDTEYVFPLFDSDLAEVNFDPSGATTKKLRFKNPGVTAIQERTAVAEQRMINGVNTWCLVYTVTQAEVTGATPTFHVATGLVKIQAVLDYSGSLWHSNIVSKDYNSEDIRIYPNL